MEPKASLPDYPLRVRPSPPREPVFRQFLPFISRRFWTIVIAWLMAALLIDGVLHLQQPGFEATASLLMLPPDVDPMTPVTPQGGLEDAIWDQTQPLKSDLLIGRAVDRLELVRDKNWSYGSASLPPFMDGLAAPLMELGLTLKPNTPLRARTAIIGRLKNGIRLRRTSASLIVELNVTTPIPSDSVVLANTLADLYVEERLERQLAQLSKPAASAPLLGARVIDRAVEAHQAKSPLGNLEAWSALFGLIAGIGAALLLDYLDRGVGGAAKAMKKTGRPVVGSVPLLRKRDLASAPRNKVADFVIAHPMSAYAESLRNLRTSLHYAETGETPKLICVTAVRHGEGKTTIALALGRVAALAGQRVLVVDCDLRRHALSRMLGLSPAKGIVEIVSEGASWREALLRDQTSGADLMLMSESFYRPRDLFNSPALEKVFGEFRAAYDLVILSAPPALSGSDTRTVSRLSDRTILVAHWTRTPSTLLRSAIRLLEQTGSDVSGLVLNFVDPRARGRLTETDTAYQAKFATRYYKA